LLVPLSPQNLRYSTPQLSRIHDAGEKFLFRTTPHTTIYSECTLECGGLPPLLRCFTHFLVRHFAGSDKSVLRDFPVSRSKRSEESTLTLPGLIRNSWPEIGFPFLPFRSGALCSRGIPLPHNAQATYARNSTHII
jgi:hypothetical protein